jgi:hypothetical protein
MQLVVAGLESWSSGLRLYLVPNCHLLLLRP